MSAVNRQLTGRSSGFSNGR